MSQDDAVNDAPLMLTVSGLRGVVGQSLTPVVATRYAGAYGQWLQAQNNTSHAPHFVLGRDSRASGQMFEMAAIAGLLSVGCQVTSLGIVTTPGVGVMVNHLKADGGMVITASHNPGMWNGIKLLRHDGSAPPADQANEIISRFKSNHTDFVSVDQLASVQQNTHTHTVHINRILDHVDAKVIRRRKLKVVLDSVNGAGGPVTGILLRQLGVELVHLNAQPNGQFTHPPEPTKANLTSLCQVVKDHGADIGFAQDPDADRLAIVDESGHYIGEEYTLALVGFHLLSGQGHASSATVATNLSTSRMIDDVAASTGSCVVRTPVGEANVVAAIQEHQAILGGEGNGGVIFPKVVAIRDSLVGIAMVLEMLAQHGEPLSQITKQIPHYVMIKEKVDAQPEVVNHYAAKLEGHFADQDIDRRDGVRIDWPDRWVHVRPSNTEPILRIIAEATDTPIAQDLIGQVRQVLDL